MPLLKWSPTPASNTLQDGVAYPVGAMAPSSVGPGFRENYAAIKDWQLDSFGSLTSGGSANAYTLTTQANPYSGAATFADGDNFGFIANHTNTSTATLNVDSEGAKAVRKLNDQPLAAGDITVGDFIRVSYDASANGGAGAWLMPKATLGARLVDITSSNAFTSGATLTINDDAATSLLFTISGQASGFLVLSPNTAAGGGGFFFFRVGTSPECEAVADMAVLIAVTTGVLTGTTGVDGRLTISAHTDGRIYIENRTGAQRAYRYAIHALTAGAAGP